MYNVHLLYVCTCNSTLYCMPCRCVVHLFPYVLYVCICFAQTTHTCTGSLWAQSWSPTSLVWSSVQPSVDYFNCFATCPSLTGPFLKLDAEQVEEEVGSMWRTMHKLTKTFGDLPGPRRSADSIKKKLDAFKVNLPIIQTICNPGIRDRHWEKVRHGDIVMSHPCIFSDVVRTYVCMYVCSYTVHTHVHTYTHTHTYLLGCILDR